jgi:hypothetical protein
MLFAWGSAPNARFLGKSHLMRDLAIGCVLRAIGKKACEEATKFGKLLSTVVGLQNRSQT